MEDAVKRQFYERNKDSAILFRDYLENKFGGAWNFNEIIGFIRLHFLGSQMRGEYWQVKAKRICKTRNKIFQYRTHKLAAEMWIPVKATNSQIFSLVIKYLEYCANELKGRYIDTVLLQKMGPHIDWRNLLNSHYIRCNGHI
jgi:hypothetical protein